ncbi:SAM-dependent methyltransferase [Marinicella sp. W31]|uniref:SAM-dependent methyltransferase n=1 Tax=Marinicella sp. W31 TaxID=3023713 RepID=UPI0037578878
MIKALIKMVEKGRVPDFLVRKGIRHLLVGRLKQEYSRDPERNSERFHAFLKELKDSDVAIDTDKANEQHYEIPAAFYDLVLGERKKYSSSFFQDKEPLDKAELTMLNYYAERGQFKDGMNILELGCGWGSLTLFLARNYPNSKITAISNSASQREYIMGQAKKHNITNINIITEDINWFNTDDRFDRVVSIEMFEHVRNYETLFSNIGGWLKDDGKLFVHIFCHRYCMYPFQVEGSDDWMAKYFFSGGQMPAADTFLFFQNDLNIEQRWMVNGQHYEKTSNCWLENMDKNKNDVITILKQVYGDEHMVWFHRWRLFFMACAELFGYDKGNEWMVGHYLFSKK